MTSPADFDADGRLVSALYGDVYFSGDGVAETEHVFVAGNDLGPRFAGRDGAFVIGETGFGTGLNFLVAKRLFLETAPAAARLVFVSTERHPLPTGVVARAHARLPGALQPLAARLREAWFARDDAGMRATFADGRVQLVVLPGDALASLRAHTFAADAWFLDGFAPAKNPAMWSSELLREVAAHTAAAGTLATYTVAGAVRRGLADAGFAVERGAGHGDKREMLRGRLDAAATSPPSRLLRPPARVLVRGAGIAGASVARAFASRGVPVTVVDPKGPAAGASGVPAAAVRPRLWLPGEHAVPDAELVAHAFRCASAWLGAHAPTSFRRCGVLLVPTDAEHEATLRRRAENPATADLVAWQPRDRAAALAGIALPGGAVWIERGGACDLGALTRELLAHARITCTRGEVDPEGALLVWATGAPPATAQIPALRPVHATRGQALGVRWPTGAPRPRAVICTSGYVCPAAADDDVVWLGSTYDRGDADDDVRPADDERVLAKFGAVPALATALADAGVASRFAGVRRVAPNRLPLVGFVERDDGSLVATSLAHGSRGAVTAPFAAELLAAAAFAEPLPVPPDLWRRLAPATS